MDAHKVRERDLVLQFKTAKEKLNELKAELKQAQEEFDRAESEIIEFLESISAVSTAKYEGIGYAQIQKPRLYANCRQENQEKLFEFLRQLDRADLIKTTVMPQSLSSFVSECIENGVGLPDVISYYLKPSVRLYS